MSLLPFPPPLPAFVLSMMCTGLSISAFEQSGDETLGASAFPSYPPSGGGIDPTVLLKLNAKLAALPTQRHRRFAATALHCSQVYSPGGRQVMHELP